MRPALALLFAATAWATTCRDALPCEVISPTLNVFLAQILENHVAQKSNDENTPMVPIRMKAVATFYGKPPNGEFIYQVWASLDLRAGDQFYIEEDARWQQPLRSVPCGHSGHFEQSRHQSRIDYFRQLTTDKPPRASVRIWVHSETSRNLSGATARLAGPLPVKDQQTDAKGSVEWTGLPAGRYTVSVNQNNYSVAESSTSLAPIVLLPGACAYRRIPMKPGFSISGRAQTSDGSPAAKLKIHVETPDGKSMFLSAITNDAGEFTVPSIDAGKYILFAGDRRLDRSPYPPTWYPGVPSKDLAQIVPVDESNPHPSLQFTVPRPSPTRELTLKILTSPEITRVQSGGLFLYADPALVYSQRWSPDTETLSAVVVTTKPIKFCVTTVFPPRSEKAIESSEMEIAPGETNLTIPVQLQLKK